MLYIVGGASRTGKSIVSRRFMTATGIPCFSLDILMMGLANGFPEYGVDPNDPAFDNARIMWPIVRGMLVNMIETQTDYIVEGYTILPEHCHQIQEQFPGTIKCCFLGYATVLPDKKVKDIRAHSDFPNDWSKTSSDREVRELVERSIEYSSFLQKECSKYEIPYFDQSDNFVSSIRQVSNYLNNRD